MPTTKPSVKHSISALRTSLIDAVAAFVPPAGEGGISFAPFIGSHEDLNSARINIRGLVFAGLGEVTLRAKDVLGDGEGIEGLELSGVDLESLAIIVERLKTEHGAKKETGTILSQKLKAALALDEESMLHRVGLKAEEAIAFLSATGDDLDKDLAAFVSECAKLTIFTDWNDRERFFVGKEYSRVIYVNIGAMGDRQARLKAIRAVAKKFDADETYFYAATGMMRFWWD